MTESDLRTLTTTLLWGTFALSAVFGALAQRTHFCTMGAIADVVNMGDWTRIRMWVLAIAVAIVGFNGMVGTGWIEARHSIYAGPQLLWLSMLVGGSAFGFGMVLASGCGSKNLVRLGGGSLKALVVFVVLAAASFATLRGLTAVLRVATVDAFSLQLPKGQGPAHADGCQLRCPSAVRGCGPGPGHRTGPGGLGHQQARGAHDRRVVGGAGVGAVVVAMWWLSGRYGHVLEHPVTLEDTFLATNSRRMEALSMASSVGYALDWLLYFSDASKLLTIGIVSLVGVVVGSAAVALVTRSFRWESFSNVEDMSNHLIGAILMGVGGVTALGCTIGQGLSGISTLSLGSALALAGIVAGALAAFRYQSWRLDRMG